MYSVEEEIIGSSGWDCGGKVGVVGECCVIKVEDNGGILLWRVDCGLHGLIGVTWDVPGVLWNSSVVLMVDILMSCVVFLWPFVLCITRRV